jgi:hypothetical protein
MRRPGRWSTESGSVLRRTTGVVLAATLVACGPPRVDVPSEQPARTTAASPNPSATVPPPTPAPATPESPEPVPGNLLAAPGAIVIANIEERPSGPWRLEVDVVQRDGSVTSGAIDFGVPDGWKPRTQLGQVRMTADGWTAIDIATVDELAPDDNGVAIFDLLGDREPFGPILGVSAMWLPDGSLLLSPDGDAIIRRIADRGAGEVTELVDDGGSAPIPARRRGYIVEGDLSGIVGWEAEYGHPPYVTMGWDGSITPRPASQATYLAMGIERLAGAGGARTVYRGACHIGDPCEYDWRRQGGERLPVPGVPWDLAWTRDGAELIVFDGFLAEELQGSHVARIKDGPGGLAVTPLAPVPFRGLPTGQITWIGGMSDWAVAIENDDDQVAVIPLDGSPALGPFDGWVALVNP